MTPLLEKALRRVATRHGRPEHWRDYVDEVYHTEVFAEIDAIGIGHFAFCAAVLAAFLFVLPLINFLSR